MFHTQYVTILNKFGSYDEAFPTVDIQRVKNVCNVLEKLLLEMTEKYANNTKEDLTKKINYIFLYAVVWGLMASFD